MNRADDLEEQIRAVLAAEASPGRVVAVRRQSPGMREFRRAVGSTTTTLALTVLIAVVAVSAGLGLANWRAPHATPSESQAVTGAVPAPVALPGASPSAGLVQLAALG